MNKFFSIVRMEILSALEFRTDVIIFALSGIARPLIFLFIWVAAVNSGAKTPLTKEEFVVYYLLVMVIGFFVSAWSAPFVSAKIRYGNLSTFLLKPFLYLYQDLGMNLGEKTIKLVYLLPVFLFIWFLFQLKLPSLNFFGWVAFALGVLLAFGISYLVNICIGLSAFWIQESRQVEDFIDLLSYVFSGYVFPLALLSASVQKIGTYLPFRYMLSFPLEIYLQKLTVAEMIFGLGMQVFWFGIAVLTYHQFWTKGLKKYSAVGA